jgi:drug/metabolite transporter (DMT)-like permease
VDELAAVLALLAAVTFALAATLWQKAALSLTNVSVRHPTSFLVLLTRWVWLLGLAAQIVGVVLQAAALDRGRVSIIQPLLVTTVIWALPLGYFLTHQAIGGREVVGAAIKAARSSGPRSSSSASRSSRASVTRRPGSTTRRDPTGRPRSS